MIKMRRTENSSWIRPEEVFFDGVLPVVDDTVTIPKGKEHWELQLLLRGFVRVDEVDASVEEADAPQEDTHAEPKKTPSRKKVTNGKTGK